MKATRLAMLLPAIFGLVVSVVLFVDYQSVVPLACGEGGGCDAVKHTSWASLFGVSTPMLGVAAFSLLASLAIASGELARKLHVAIAVISALFGLFFIGVQVKLGRFCPYCLVADVSSVLALVGAFWALRSPPEPLGPLGRWGLGLFTLACALLPMLYFSEKAVVIPDALRAEIAAHEKGQITILDFADFECPYCRMMHENLLLAMKGHEHQIHLVRKHVPLRMHPHAPDAARAGVCGEKMGKGEEMANALFRAPLGELTPVGTTKLAVALALDEQAFVKCLNEPATDAVQPRDRALYDAIGAEGLPLLWIGYTRLTGVRAEGELRSAIERELSR